LAIGYAVAVVTFLGFTFARPSIGWFILFFGFGKFSVKNKGQRRGRNPATGDELMLCTR
jgi:integration host factor subunit alpha